MAVYSVLFGHLDSIAVKEGQILNQNDVIGVMGNTGLSEGAHLHLTVVPGRYTEHWSAPQVPGLGGTRAMVENFANANGGKLFRNNSGIVSYRSTGGWLSYAGHYALDMVASGSGWPSIVWNQSFPGKVIAVRNYGSGRTGKTVIVEFGEIKSSASGGSKAAITDFGKDDYSGEYRNFDFSAAASTKRFEILIQYGDHIIEPPIVGDITLDLERKVMPGVLKFKTLSNVKYIGSGNPITFKLDGKKVFMGFVFTQKISGDFNEVTAYDQIRYLKNKDSYIFKNLRADQIIWQIAKDQKLQVGILEHSIYVIPSRVEDSESLADMISNAIDETVMNAKQLFVLYDDFGKLMLVNIANMKVPILVDEETGESFDLSKSIDSKTFNKIKLYRDNEEKGVREVYIAQDTSTRNRWGLLQFYEKVDEGVDAVAKANALLKLYNVEEKTLKIKGVFGDTRVIGGSLIMVKIGDANSWMLVESVKHVFSENEHRMDLVVQGGGYVA